MNRPKLIVGRIPYANLYPLFHTLCGEFDCSDYLFVDGHPSELNKMLREGSVDVSPSSSIEYLRNKNLYTFLEGHSVSSRGPVGSIFLFSRKRIGQLEDSVIHATSRSETSVGLLSVILTSFLGVRHTLVISDNPSGENGDAFLLIGDEAIRCRREIPCITEEGISDEGVFYVYDLGDIWHRHTGLPFVFALWIVNRNTHRDTGKSALLAQFAASLDQAKGLALSRLGRIAPSCPLVGAVPEIEILSYWKNLDYDLTENHRKGLNLFETHLREISS